MNFVYCSINSCFTTLTHYLLILYFLVVHTTTDYSMTSSTHYFKWVLNMKYMIHSSFKCSTIGLDNWWLCRALCQTSPRWTLLFLSLRIAVCSFHNFSRERLLIKYSYVSENIVHPHYEIVFSFLTSKQKNNASNSFRMHSNLFVEHINI